MEQDTVGTIVDLIGGKGQRQYGLSAIDQRAHALQTALLAGQAGCDSALIVAAKRYLCGKEADYFARLSAGEIVAFESQPHDAKAVQLRRFDEGAKVKG